jgi:hypothetical protein
VRIDDDTVLAVRTRLNAPVEIVRVKLDVIRRHSIRPPRDVGAARLP